jgi:parallel beta-helix repeat protein
MTSRAHRMFGSMALFIGVALSILAVQPAAAATEINACPFVIVAPGQYRVANDLVLLGAGACITIQASDVHLNMAGHTMTGPTSCNVPSVPLSFGIVVGAVSNVHINNGTVGGGFTEGIRLNATTDSRVNGMLVTQNCLFGIRLVNAMHNSFHAITVELTMNPPQHCAGYRLDASNGNVITSNKIVRNGEAAFDDTGIELFGSNSNTIQSTEVSDNIADGIQLLANSDSNVVRSNTVTNNVGHGIQAGSLSDRNLIQANKVTGSAGAGIYLQLGATFNTVQANTSLGNNPLLGDARDDNPACDNNVWMSNHFVTDFAGGLPDGGENAGCIQ